MSKLATTILTGVLLLGVALGIPARATAATASGALPFRPLSSPTDRFAASNLTRAYEKDVSLFLNSQGPRVDLAELDRHGYFPYGDRPYDPEWKSLVESGEARRVAEMSPKEKDEVTPPTAGVQVGIPSAVAATGALIGGLALLVKILTLGI